MHLFRLTAASCKPLAANKKIMSMELIQTFKKSYFLKMSDDKHLIAQVNSSQINIFENETYRHLAQFKEVGDASVFFSDDSNLLLAKNNDRKLVVYDLATMSIRCKLKPKIGSSNGDGDALSLIHI